MKLILICLFMFPTAIFAQSMPPESGIKLDSGIRFINGLSWEQIKVKAKAEKKYIFIDCYATWCKPCKKMDKEVFTRTDVGNFMNERFVCLKLQMDTTSNDSEHIKTWRMFALNIIKLASIDAYPTFLYFDSNGELTHKVVGSYLPSTFILQSRLALNPTNQFYSQLKQFKDGRSDSIFLRNLIAGAQAVNDQRTISLVANYYISQIKDENLFQKDNLYYISLLTQNSKDIGFNILLNNEKKIDSILNDRGYVRERLAPIIYKEEAQDVVEQSNDDPLRIQDWNRLETKIFRKYGNEHTKRVIIIAKMEYFIRKSLWKKYASTALEYLQEYGQDLPFYAINEFAYLVFKYSESKVELRKALNWMEIKVPLTEAPDIDTYANLLYKLNQVDKAVRWQEKAVSLAPKDDEIIGNYNKMKLRQPTWHVYR